VAVMSHNRSDRKGLVQQFNIALSCFLLAGCGGNTAPSPTPAALSPAQVAAGKIMKAVAEPTEWDLLDTPLKDFAEAIEIRHGIHVLLDAKPLADVGITGETPITYSAKGITLNSALAQVLQPRKLSYVIDHGVLLITTAAKAKEMDR
jgi:hypothetical protein